MQETPRISWLERLPFTSIFTSFAVTWLKNMSFGIVSIIDIKDLHWWSENSSISIDKSNNHPSHIYSTKLSIFNKYPFYWWRASVNKSVIILLSYNNNYKVQDSLTINTENTVEPFSKTLRTVLV